MAYQKFWSNEFVACISNGYLVESGVHTHMANNGWGEQIYWSYELFHIFLDTDTRHKTSSNFIVVIVLAEVSCTEDSDRVFLALKDCTYL